MHETLEAITEELEKVISELTSKVPSDEPMGNAQGNWSFPGLTKAELIDEAQSIIDSIEAFGVDEIGDAEKLLADYPRRLQFLCANTIPNIWGNASQGVSAYYFTLRGLRKALAPAMSRDFRAEIISSQRKLQHQLRTMETRLKALDPRTVSIADMVERIEQAYNAADQLPTDLESLSEARQKIAELVEEATKDKGHLLGIRGVADELDQKLKEDADAAEAVLERCKTAYAAATSVGLAAAFNERSDALAKSMWFWVAGLVVALFTGALFGSRQLHTLSELFNLPNPSTSVIVLNLALSLLSVGAPVWFAWLATKQIGQRFRLSEDYAFKASISRAYEGFRREAARIDEDMEARLLASALTRLDELPLRLVETESHGSPWHELASSDIVKRAMKVVPGFADQVKNLAGKTIASLTVAKRAGADSTVPSAKRQTEATSQDSA